MKHDNMAFVYRYQTSINDYYCSLLTFCYGNTPAIPEDVSHVQLW
jgi:hypothetical protein